MSKTLTRKTTVLASDLRHGDLLHHHDQRLKVGMVELDPAKPTVTVITMWAINDGWIELEFGRDAQLAVTRPRPTYGISVEITPDSDVIPEDVAINIETYLKNYYPNAVVETNVTDAPAPV